jgi:UDP-N-acetylmuramoyl-tripeptide--D-alanyl-D-alanine ligase
VAVTGSTGKTTVKEMVAAILAHEGAVLATRGNLNNEIGVPLTLFNLDAEHRYAVVEIGANHPGEIAHLCRIVQPTVAIITQCAPAHLEGFGSVEGVARAKGEIVTGLQVDGTAVLNADDPYIGLWRTLGEARRIITFGLRQPAEVTARIHSSGGPDHNTFDLVMPTSQLTVRLPLPGRHNVMNAMSAATCALALGATPEAIRAGLEGMHAVNGRMVVNKGVGGARVIDDTYNANPSSLRAAIDVLIGYPGRRWLVLGDMGELGPQTATLHREAGAYARAHGVDRLLALGPLTTNAIAGFGGDAEHFDDVGSLVTALKPALGNDVTVLVKGSRAMQMERVVQAIMQGR